MRVLYGVIQLVQLPRYNECQYFRVQKCPQYLMKMQIAHSSAVDEIAGFSRKFGFLRRFFSSVEVSERAEFIDINTFRNKYELLRMSLFVADDFKALIW